MLVELAARLVEVTNMSRNLSSVSTPFGIRDDPGWIINGLFTLWASAGIFGPNKDVSPVVTSKASTSVQYSTVLVLSDVCCCFGVCIVLLFIIACLVCLVKVFAVAFLVLCFNCMFLVCEWSGVSVRLRKVSGCCG